MHTTRTPRTAAIVLLGLFTFASMGPAVAARSRPGPGELALTSSAKKPDTEAAKRVRTAYAGMPLRFERAAGAAAAKAEFIARGAGYALDLSKGEPGSSSAARQTGRAPQSRCDSWARQRGQRAVCVVFFRA